MCAGPRELFLEDPIQDCANVLAPGTASVGWVIAFVVTYSFTLLLSQFEVFAVFPQLLLHIISDDRRLILDAHTYTVCPVVENSCSCRAQSSRCRSTHSHEDGSRSSSRNLWIPLKYDTMDKSRNLVILKSGIAQIPDAGSPWL